MRVAGTLRFNQAQSTARHRDDDVVQTVNMLAGFRTGRESPLGYDYSFVFDLYDRNGFHVCNPLLAGYARILAAEPFHCHPTPTPAALRRRRHQEQLLSSATTPEPGCAQTSFAGV